MSLSTPDQAIRFYLMVVTALLGAATAYVYATYGLGLGAALLCVLTALAFWGAVSDKAWVRRLIGALYTG